LFIACAFCVDVSSITWLIEDYIDGALGLWVWDLGWNPVLTLADFHYSAPFSCVHTFSTMIKEATPKSATTAHVSFPEETERFRAVRRVVKSIVYRPDSVQALVYDHS
jgi:hypothetical protein